MCEPPRDVGHAMVCPTDRDLILYTSDVNQRMWLAAVGRGELGPLHRHDKREWITHESFLGASDQVIFARWPFALMAIGTWSTSPMTLLTGSRRCVLYAGLDLYQTTFDTDG